MGEATQDAKRMPEKILTSKGEASAIACNLSAFIRPVKV
jgi:hypothetical protein